MARMSFRPSPPRCCNCAPKARARLNWPRPIIAITTLIEGIKIARRISRTAPLDGLVTGEHAPGPDVGLDDDAATLDWAKQTAVTIYHPTGTCKMGQDKLAVVDERLRVRGIDGLRIADASIMPVITSGNTNAPCIMIGEKASAMILEDVQT